MRGYSFILVCPIITSPLSSRSFPLFIWASVSNGNLKCSTFAVSHLSKKKVGLYLLYLTSVPWRWLETVHWREASISLETRDKSSLWCPLLLMQTPRLVVFRKAWCGLPFLSNRLTREASEADLVVYHLVRCSIKKNITEVSLKLRQSSAGDFMSWIKRVCVTCRNGNRK